MDVLLIFSDLPDAEQVFSEYVRINEDKGYSTAKFIQKDIEFCIELAKELNFAIEYAEHITNKLGVEKCHTILIR